MKNIAIMIGKSADRMRLFVSILCTCLSRAVEEEEEEGGEEK